MRLSVSAGHFCLHKNVRDGRITECAFGFANADAAASWKTTAIRMEGCDDYAIDDNLFERFTTGIEGQKCERVRITGNRLTAPSVGDGSTQQSAGAMGIAFTDTVGIDVERNLLAHYRRGIQIGDVSAPSTAPPLDLGRPEAGCRIVANVVDRRGGGMLDNLTVASNAKVIGFAIAARMPRCEILENAVRLDGNSHGGILADGGNLLIARNLLSSIAVFGASSAAYIIPHGVVAALRDDDGRACVIRDNLFTGLQQAVFVSGAPKSAGAIQRVDVSSNHIVGSPELFKVMLTLAGNIASSPQALFDVIALVASIVMTNVKGGRVAHNEISTAVGGVLCGDVTEVVVQGNAISKSVAGVVLGLGGACDVADNMIDGGIMGVVIGAARSSVVQRNVVTRTALGILDLMGTGTRIQDNDVSGGAVGIQLFATADAEVRGNTVEDASIAGLGALPLKAVTFAHNTARRCGYRANAKAAAFAFGIGVMADDATVLIESCQALDVGVSSAATDPIFQGRRFGIVVNAVRGRARVRGCTITSPSIATRDGGPGENPASRALLISAGKPAKPSRTVNDNAEPSVIKSQDADSVADFADATDNLAEQTATPVVEIAIAGEVIFSANRCRRLDSEGANGPVVMIAGSCLAVHGNRVHAQGGPPSLELMASRALTAVGNVTTTDAAIGGVQELPAPYSAYNVRT